MQYIVILCIKICVLHICGTHNNILDIGFYIYKKEAIYEENKTI